MSYWTVAMTKPGNENIAKFNLDRQSFETYLPKYLTRIGKEIKVKVLFPRYIFVRIDLQWHQINGTRGVARLIMNETKPAHLPDQIVKDLRLREDSKGLIMLPETPKFVQGQQLKVIKGPLEGHIGIYEGMKDVDRVRILLDFLGRPTVIETSSDSVESITLVKQNES